MCSGETCSYFRYVAVKFKWKKHVGLRKFEKIAEVSAVLSAGRLSNRPAKISSKRSLSMQQNEKLIN